MSWSRILASAIILAICFGSCHKIDPNNNPIPVWEDLGPDSVTMHATIQTVTGILIPGQYVNLALSPDSLNNGILVRRAQTDGQGSASFQRLFPRTYFVNCYVTYQGRNYYGNFILHTKPYMRLDTLLTVY